jgi:pyruvate formate lyase activating enzyme
MHGAVSAAEDGFRTAAERCVACGRCVEVCAPDGRELVGTVMTVSGLLAEVERDRVFFEESGGGVTVSGGEPLLQHGFLVRFLDACSRRGLRTAVDTTGYAAPEVIRRVSAWADLFLYDLKIMDPVRHREFTGVSNERILSNLRLLSSLDKEIIIRIPLVPGVNDGAENIEATGRFIASLTGVSAVHLLPYHAIASEKYRRLGMSSPMEGVMPPAQEHVLRIAGQLGAYHTNVIPGG